MALIGYEGFDNLATSGSTNLAVKPFTTGLGGTSGGIWTGTGGTAKLAGLLGGFALQLNNTGNQVPCVLSANYTTSIIGFRYLVGASNSVLNDIMRFVDAGTVQSGISVNASGKLIYWRGTNGTVLATGTTTLIANSWYMIEISQTINGSTGSVQINLNAVSEITASSLNNQTSANSYINTFTLVGPGQTGTAFDDLYMVDTTGSPPYNTFLGIIRVETVYCTANDSVTWTPLISTNVSQIQEVSFDGDSTYNSTSTGGNQDSFTHAALSSTPATIFAVSITCGIRKDDVSVQSAQTVLISGVTTQLGASNALNTSYQYMRDVYLTDPNTTLAWTGSNVNATKIGYKHV